MNADQPRLARGSFHTLESEVLTGPTIRQRTVQKNSIGAWSVAERRFWGMGNVNNKASVTLTPRRVRCYIELLFASF